MNNEKISGFKLSLYIIGGIILVSFVITIVTFNMQPKNNTTNNKDEDNTNINEKNKTGYDYDSVEEYKKAAEGWGQKVQIIDTIDEEAIKIDTLDETKNFANYLASGLRSSVLDANLDDDDNLFGIIYLIISSKKADTIECINDKIINQAFYNLFNKKNVKIQSSMASVPDYYCQVPCGGDGPYTLKSEEVDNQADNSITYKYIYECDDDYFGIHQYTLYIGFVKNTKDNLYKVVRFDKVNNY